MNENRKMVVADMVNIPIDSVGVVDWQEVQERLDDYICERVVYSGLRALACRGNQVAIDMLISRSHEVGFMWDEADMESTIKLFLAMSYVMDYDESDLFRVVPQMLYGMKQKEYHSIKWDQASLDGVDLATFQKWQVKKGSKDIVKFLTKLSSTQKAVLQCKVNGLKGTEIAEVCKLASKQVVSNIIHDIKVLYKSVVLKGANPYRRVQKRISKARYEEACALKLERMKQARFERGEVCRCALDVPKRKLPSNVITQKPYVFKVKKIDGKVYAIRWEVYIGTPVAMETKKRFKYAFPTKKRTYERISWERVQRLDLSKLTDKDLAHLEECAKKNGTEKYLKMFEYQLDHAELLEQSGQCDCLARDIFGITRNARTTTCIVRKCVVTERVKHVQKKEINC